MACNISNLFWQAFTTVYIQFITKSDLFLFNAKNPICFYSQQKIGFGLISVQIILSINYSKIKWNCIALHSAPTWINVCNIYDQSTASHVISNWYKANTVGYLFVSLFWWFVYCSYWFECLDVIKRLIWIKRHTLIKRHPYRIFDFVMNKKKGLKYRSIKNRLKSYTNNKINFLQILRCRLNVSNLSMNIFRRRRKERKK